MSFLLRTPIADSLCGTKLITNSDKNRMYRWKKDFGDFDPFGDFNLLFSAAELCLGVVDVPIRYRERTYGTTNISQLDPYLMRTPGQWPDLCQISNAFF